ncbi:MAG: AIR synthase related protein, partial [Candidatus Micrarchaeia archaeon]
MAGEREIVRGLLASTGISNDDAALLGKLAITTDISFASSHSPKGLSYYNMGWRSAASNLSDLAAMGAKPLAFLLAQGLPAKIAGKAASSIASGVSASCKYHHTTYAGGDTKKANELTLAGFALGRIAGIPLLRKNAKAGDIICASGEIGSAFCGFHALTHNKTKSTPK